MAYRDGEQQSEQQVRPSEIVQNYLTDRSWIVSEHQRVEDEGEVIFMLEFAAENASSIPVKIVARDTSRQVLFIAACPFVVPESRKVATIWRLIEYNRTLAIGAFVLAADEKILTFRTGIDFLDPETDLTKNLIDCQLKLTLETMDEGLPEFIKILFSADEPLQTLEEYFGGKIPKENLQ